MRKRVFAISAVAALVGAGAATAIGMAGGSDGAPTGAALEPAHQSTGKAVHRVAKPSAGAQASSASVTAAAKGPKPRIKYFQTGSFPISNGQAFAERLRCPRKHRVLGGYFGTPDGTDVALTHSVPVNQRAWWVGVTKLGISTQPPGAATANAVLGIVCAQNVN